eukprot:1446235-Alexandrium_andersonii.AAC.1
MSASLVGSEMCIRDRLDAPGCGHAMEAALVGAGSGSAVFPPRHAEEPRRPGQGLRAPCGTLGLARDPPLL